MDFSALDIFSILRIPPQFRSTPQVESLMKLTQNVQFFRKISTEENFQEMHKECCKAMTLEEYSSDDFIFDIGAAGTKFFIILTGSVSIKIPSKKQFHIGKESITRIENDLFFRPDSQDSLAEGTPRPSLKLRSTLQLPETIPKLLSSLTIRENVENRLSNDEKLFLNLLRQKTPSEQEALIRKVKECDSDKCELEVIDHLEIGILYAGSSFGELALISDKPRSASVQARERSSFLVLTKTDFKKILGSMSENKLLNQVKFLQRVHYFQNWSKSSLTKIAYYFDTLKFKKNQPVYKEGDQVEGIYFIREGEIVIEKKVVCKAETPSVFSSSPKHFAVKAVKKTRIVNDVKIIIKSKFEAFGGLEVCDRLDRRQFSAVCASALSEVLFIKKEDFLNRVPNLENIRGLVLQESDRVRALFSEIMEKEENLRNSSFMTGLIEKHDFPTLSPILKVKTSSTCKRILPRLSKSPASHFLRKLTKREIEDAVNGRSSAMRMYGSKCHLANSSFARLIKRAPIDLLR